MIGPLDEPASLNVLMDSTAKAFWTSISPQVLLNHSVGHSVWEVCLQGQYLHHNVLGHIR